eukprot:2727561-Amphidinium_carterae.1
MAWPRGSKTICFTTFRGWLVCLARGRFPRRCVLECLGLISLLWRRVMALVIDQLPKEIEG